MTEYELSDLIATQTGNGTAILSLFVTVVSGYLIVSWLVGQRLSPPQAALINMLFVFFSGLCIFAWFARFMSALSYQSELAALNPQRVSPFQTEKIVIGTAVLLVIVMIACLKFMWDVRHPKTE
jgi:hypothetical protein